MQFDLWWSRKCSLDSIQSPSPSLKIQIMSGKVCFRQNIPWSCFQKFVDIIQQCFALLLLVKFPAINLNFHWRGRWSDQIQTIFLHLFYFTKDLESFAQQFLVIIFLYFNLKQNPLFKTNVGHVWYPFRKKNGEKKKNL